LDVQKITAGYSLINDSSGIIGRACTVLIRNPTGIEVPISFAGAAGVVTWY
jgi:hypothetical protein